MASAEAEVVERWDVNTIGSPIKYIEDRAIRAGSIVTGFVLRAFSQEGDVQDTITLEPTPDGIIEADFDMRDETHVPILSEAIKEHMALYAANHKISITDRENVPDEVIAGLGGLVVEA